MNARIFLVGVLAAALVLSACQTTPVKTDELTIEIDAMPKISPEEIDAGITPVTFKNLGQAPISALIARLNEGVSLTDFLEALDQGPEAALGLVSLVGGLETAPNGLAQETLDLKPGTHVVLGMGGPEGPPQLASFEVRDTAQTQPAPVADVNADLMDFAIDLPAAVEAGSQRWKLENKGAQWHEVNIVQLAEGVTVDDLLAAVEQGGWPDDSQFNQVAAFTPISAGERVWVTVDLEPGTYYAVCLLPDLLGDGAPHLAHGMLREFTVK